MAFVKIEKLITPALTRAGVKKQADIALALERAEFCIKEFLGDDAALELKPIAIRYKHCTSPRSIMAPRLPSGASESDVLEYINGIFRQPLVERIRYRNLMNPQISKLLIRIGYILAIILAWVLLSLWSGMSELVPTTLCSQVDLPKCEQL